MRFPLTAPQALILIKLINGDKLLKREMDWQDLVILTQVGAIKMTKQDNIHDGLIITKKGRSRFVKWARKEGHITK